jgi:pilus assembly protein CpaC
MRATISAGSGRASRNLGLLGRLRSGVAALVAGILAGAVPLGLAAQAQQAVSGVQTAVTLPVGEGRLFRLDKDATNVLVADAAVADAQIVSPRMIYVYGRKIGATSITAVSKDSSAGTLNVRVVHSASGARASPGAAPVSLSFLGDRLVISGTVPGPAAALDALASASAFNTSNRTPLDRTRFVGSQQITLRVRIAEVSRTALNTLGINWNIATKTGGFGLSLLTGGFLQSSTNILSGLNLAQNYGLGGGSVTSKAINADALINALQREQVLSLLAEPNLTTVSGRTAKFLAGGQVPIPVPQSLGVTTIEYKPYGVSLAFTPTLLPGNRIALDVHPEVSEIDTSNAVTIDSTSVPAFTTRSAETTVEMASGQTIAIAGLFTRSVSSQLDRYPFLGDIPVLGALFRSRTYQRGETELVILITPYLTEPVSAQDALPLPTDDQSHRNSSGSAGGFVVN